MASFDLTPPTEGEFNALAAELDDEERKVLLEHGTEAPFCGALLDEKREGLFTSRLCGLPLFHGGAKFESGTGWPSFAFHFQPDFARPCLPTGFPAPMTGRRFTAARRGSRWRWRSTCW